MHLVYARFDFVGMAICPIIDDEQILTDTSFVPRRGQCPEDRILLCDPVPLAQGRFESFLAKIDTNDAFENFANTLRKKANSEELYDPVRRDAGFRAAHDRWWHYLDRTYLPTASQSTGPTV